MQEQYDLRMRRAIIERDAARTVADVLVAVFDDLAALARENGLRPPTAR